MTSINYPDDTPVEVRFPLTDTQARADREQWPWLPGTVLERVGPDEYRVCVEVKALATLQGGRKPRKNTPSHKLYYPCCFRDSSELREAQA